MAAYTSPDGLVLFNHAASMLGKAVRFVDHSHPMHECCLYMQGGITFRWNHSDISPTPGSLLFIPQGLVHSLEADEQAVYKRYTLHFYEEALPNPLRAYLREILFSQLLYLQDAHDLLSDFRALEECFEMPEKVRKEAIEVRLTALLLHLSRHPQRRRETLAQGVISQVLEYIHMNVSNAEMLTTDALAQQFYVSKSQLSKLFLRQTHTSLAKYIRQRRFEYAEILRAQGMPAEEAANTAGFQSYSTYYRIRNRHHRS